MAPSRTTSMRASRGVSFHDCNPLGAPLAAWSSPDAASDPLSPSAVAVAGSPAAVSPAGAKRVIFGEPRTAAGHSQPGSGQNSPRAISRTGSLSKNISRTHSSQLTSPAGTGGSPDLAQYIAQHQAKSRRGSNLGPHHDSSPIQWHTGLMAVPGDTPDRRGTQHSTDVMPFVPEHNTPPSASAVPPVKSASKSLAWMEVEDADEAQQSPRESAMLPEPPLPLAHPTTLHVPAARRQTVEAGLPGQPEDDGGSQQPASAVSPTAAGSTGPGAVGPSCSRPPPAAALANLMQSNAFSLPMPKLGVAWTVAGQQKSTHPRPIAENDSEGNSPTESRQPSGTIKKSASAHKWF
jgi:hypothetical protein